MSIDVEKIVRENIDKTVHMSLATAAGSKPWVCEVHFAYDDSLNLYFVSLLTTRHCQEIASNPKVAGNIVKQHSLDESPNGIYFEGEAQTIENATDEDIERYCTRLARDKNELATQLNQPNGHRMYRIQVSDWAVFGKFGEEKNQKHQLKWNGGKP